MSSVLELLSVSITKLSRVMSVCTSFFYIRSSTPTMSDQFGEVTSWRAAGFIASTIASLKLKLLLAVWPFTWL